MILGHKDFRNAVFLALFFSIFIQFSSCRSIKPTLQKKFGANTHYFLGLKNLEANVPEEARKNFLLCMKKGDGLCRRESFENYILLQNRKNRFELEEEYLKNYSDEKALLFAAKDFYSSEEYSKAIFYTENLNLKESSNELIKIRLESMIKKEDSRLKNEFFSWITERTLRSEHFTFCKEHEDLLLEKLSEEEAKISSFRINVARKNYEKAFLDVEEITNLSEKLSLNSVIFSDIGKTYLYGSKNPLGDAQKLLSLSEEISESAFSDSKKFYLSFYSARLFDKSGDYYSRAEKCYKSAMDYALLAKEDDHFDTALWYLLKMKIRRNSESGVQAIIEYSKKWKNKAYFDDLLDLISNLLMTEGRWNSFSLLAEALDGYASEDMVSRFGYIASRLLEEGLAEYPENCSTSQEKSAYRFKFYTLAMSAKNEYYYKTLSAAKLGYSREEAEELFLKDGRGKNAKNFSLPENFFSEAKTLTGTAKTGKPEEKSAFSQKFSFTQKDAETLLTGYAAFGFPEKIYPSYINLSQEGAVFSMDTLFSLSKFLFECAPKHTEFYTQSLRIAAKASASTEREITQEELKLFFPQAFKDIIDFYAEEYKIPYEILYALIRSESFFDKGVRSVSDAKGLTQLMDSTASDVARKLKIKDYDLSDPDTNVNLGSFYLAELSRRLDDSYFYALLSYNTGITRIRRWKNQKGNLPLDLFLEIAPYEETRGYGRKLFSAGAMYAWLYEGKDIEAFRKEFFR